MARRDESNRDSVAGSDKLSSRPKKATSVAALVKEDAREARGIARVSVQAAISSAKTALDETMTSVNLALDEVAFAQGFVDAEIPLIQEIDAALLRLEVGIAKQREAMDDLLERIRQPAT